MNGSLTNWKILPSPSEKNLPLEIHVINLRGQDSLKFQKCVQKIEKSRPILERFKKISLQLSSIHGVTVSTFVFQFEGRKFDS